MMGTTNHEKARSIVRCLDEYLNGALSGDVTRKRTAREFLILALEIALSEANGETVETSKREKFHEQKQS